MRISKRIVGVLLAFVLVFGTILAASPLIAADTSATVGSGWSGYTQWILTEDGTLRVYGSGTMKNYTTKTEMPWYKYAGQIRNVVISDGVKSIGDYAFYGMPALETVQIADSVTSIGDYAFKNCGAMESVNLPTGLSNLGDSAFYACSSLESIEIPASLYTVKPYAFKNCASLSEVILHEGNLMKLSDGAFYGCTSLREIEFPVCLDIIDVYCFKGCSSLASITIPEGDLTQIREAVFYGTAIPVISIPEGVTVIKPYAFKNCTKLVSVVLPESLTAVEEAGFYACTALKQLTLPDAVTTIGNYALRKCTALRSVSFSENLVTIGESSFYGCESLIALEIPDAVTTIKGYAFKGCIGLTDVDLGVGLTALGESAFHTCTGLTEIAIPANVDTIGDYCFSGSSELGCLTFTGDAPTIGSGAFNKVTAIAYYPADNTTWTDAMKQNYGGVITWMAQEDTVASYTVTFVDYDGTVLKTETVEEGAAATAPAAPVREGYTFIGWDKDFSCVTEDMTVTALYEAVPSQNTYTVTFTDYDGTTLAVSTVSEGADAAPPAAPSKTGADFLGWTGNYSNVTKNETVRAVYSDEKNVIVVQTLDGEAGGTVTVLVEITGQVKTCGFDFSIFFDPSLELTAYDNDLHLDIVFNDEAYENGVALNFSATTDKVKPREIVEMTFGIDEAASGALPMTLQMTSIKELSGSYIVDTEYVLVNGVVNVG